MIPLAALALIPARGGSKSIPRKNLLPIAGRPLVTYSIDQAKAARHIGRVIVSTDDSEIAEVARRHGAEVPFVRPSEYAGDLSSDLEVFDHALRWLDEHDGYRPEFVVHLRPTGPVRRVELIDAAIERLADHPDADSVRSVSGAIQTPFKMWLIGDDGLLDPIADRLGSPDGYSQPRQALPDVYWQNGYVDVVRARTILEARSMAGRRVLPFVVEGPIFEIDYPEDVQRIAAALATLQASAGAPPEPPRRKPV